MQETLGRRSTATHAVQGLQLCHKKSITHYAELCESINKTLTLNHAPQNEKTNNTRGRIRRKKSFWSSTDAIRSRSLRGRAFQEQVPVTHVFEVTDNSKHTAGCSKRRRHTNQKPGRITAVDKRVTDHDPRSRKPRETSEKPQGRRSRIQTQMRDKRRLEWSYLPVGACHSTTHQTT